MNEKAETTEPDTIKDWKQAAAVEADARRNALAECRRLRELLAQASDERAAYFQAIQEAIENGSAPGMRAILEGAINGNQR